MVLYRTVNILPDSTWLCGGEVLHMRSSLGCSQSTGQGEINFISRKKEKFFKTNVIYIVWQHRFVTLVSIFFYLFQIASMANYCSLIWESLEMFFFFCPLQLLRPQKPKKAMHWNEDREGNEFIWIYLQELWGPQCLRNSPMSSTSPSAECWLNVLGHCTIHTYRQIQ